jgi:hypothetical protein
MPKNNYWRSSESALMRWHVVDDDEGSNEILHIAYRLQDKTTVIWLLGRNQLAAYHVINYRLFYRYLLFNSSCCCSCNIRHALLLPMFYLCEIGSTLLSSGKICWHFKYDYCNHKILFIFHP